MCLIAFAWRVVPGWPLVLVAHRDEFRDRPTQPLAAWPDLPILAGRDLRSGGTWLGVAAAGRWAALTNIRLPQLPPAPVSRGDWVPRALTLDQAALQQRLQVHAPLSGPFNLLWGTPQQMWHYHSVTAELQPVAAGVHALSNARLDTPWPKVRRAQAALAAALHGVRQPVELWSVLADPQPADDVELPDTGVGQELERRLSPPLILGAGYGTVSRSQLWLRADGHVHLHEQQLDAAGQVTAEVQLQR